MTNADDTVTLDVAYADNQGTKHERVTPTGMTETDVALITVADYPREGRLCRGAVLQRQGRGDGHQEPLTTFVKDLGTVCFDTMKYGAELSPGERRTPGAMLATGWLTAKSGNQITVGDLDLF